MDQDEIVTLDGGKLEGGGQILRNCVSYSALLRKPVRIITIRAQRRPPGLRAQHLKGIELVQKLCGASVDGGVVTSETLTFLPGPLQSSVEEICADTQTAGSITLLIQTALPVLLFLPTTSDTITAGAGKTTSVLLKGGTNATCAPQVDYFLHVFLPIAERMFGNHRVSATVLRRGYYPKGGGEVRLEVSPLQSGEKIRAIDLTERGEVTRIRGYIYVGGVLPKSMAWEMQRIVLRELKLANISKENFLKLEQDLSVCKENIASGGGSGVVLWAETDTGCILAGSAIGERGKTPVSVSVEACSELLQNLETGACVDEYLQDQLIILMALAEGKSRVLTGPISLHTQTAIWVAKEMTGVDFSVEKVDDTKFLIHCEGIGYNV
ncbi:hypothetical protein R1flu_018551 [Riccia fluitans]|uniref:RNA 3'-terminal-phosphate cyclase (ATP) n=1 Tax=Riccia fluitans TaxID=41844 RepID=A0ABD1ZG53_9MARC